METRQQALDNSVVLPGKIKLHVSFTEVLKIKCSLKYKEVLCSISFRELINLGELVLLFKISWPNNPFFKNRCVKYPADKLIKKVATNLHTDKFHPIDAVLRKNISGSIDGDAIQNDITGARGTPPISSDVIIGTTPQEQNGLNAPTIVASKIETIGFLHRALLINLAAPDICTITARGIVIIR